jgi:hypothetical protein
VLIARTKAVDLPFSTLLTDLASALRRIRDNPVAAATERGPASA